MGSRRKTNEEFINESVLVHGNKYDYSKVDYVSNRTKVCIICPIHGEFYQSPIVHIHGCGCPKCGYKSKKLLCGVGVNDIECSYNTDVYNYWSRMIKRCYYTDRKQPRNSYEDCSVCNEWLVLSSFKEWFDKEYIEGFELDKDILLKGNRIYSPQTCCFVPRELNLLFTKRQSCRGELPIGVTFSNRKSKPYRAYLIEGGKQVCLGSFKSKIDAFLSYKNAKEDRIKRLALKYKDLIREEVFNALCDYKVHIND